MSGVRQATEAGRRIEERSFAIIDAEAGAHSFTEREWKVARRIIHATADLEFRDTLRFHPAAVDAGVAALRRGAPVVVDVSMIAAGLGAARLGARGSAVHCFIGDADVLAAARERGVTRAAEAMRKAHRLGLLDGAVLAVGNAPTALFELLRLGAEEGARPALVVGVPVGFVGAAESKEAALRLEVPCVVARGRKGGTPVAVAAVNALLALAEEEEATCPR
jgi:precorrin-8X/cobalt-precorrin-8 methylmutase